MKKYIAMLLALMMLFCLCACGEEPAAEQAAEAAPAEEAAPAAEAASAEDAAPAEEAAPAAAADFEPVGYDFGTCYVEVVGAEAFTDSDDKDAIRFYYDYTNNESEPACAWMALNFAAEQAGFELTGTYAAYEEDVPEYGNNDLYIYPGVTIRCVYECNYNPSAGGTVALTIDDYDVEFTTEFDAAALPGVVKEAAEIAPIAEPTYTAGLPTEGDGEDYHVALTGESEVVAGYDGEQILLVNLDFTNNSGEAASAWWKTTFYAYQDGVELETGYPKGDSELNDNYSVDIDAGETINCSVGFTLRSDSPVEVRLSLDYFEDTAIGAVYPVA